MAIRIYRPNGPSHIEYYPKTASTAFTVDQPVALSTAGRLTPYTAGGAFPFLGLCKRAWAATDATTTRTPVEVYGPDAEFLFDATTTAAAQTDVGEYVDYVLATESVNVGASTNDDVYVTDVVSATLVIGKWRRRLPILVE